MINKKILRDVRKAITEIKESVNPTLKQVFEANESILREYNAKDQLFDRGVNSLNVRIQPAYAESTKLRKFKRRQPTNRVTLRDTGQFHDSIEFEVINGVLYISTSLEYAKYLGNRYGKEILGITDINLIDFMEKYVYKELELSVEEIINKYSYD